MKCGTINPRWAKTGVVGMNATMLPDGSFLVRGDKTDEKRDFMISLIEAPEEEQEKIIKCIEKETQRVIFLVRDRLEREKPFEDFKEDPEDE